MATRTRNRRPARGVHDQRWEEQLGRLRAFRLRFGHCNVPNDWGEDRSLGVWVASQRTRWRRGQLSSERLQKLDELGFTFQVRDEDWEINFELLQGYRERFGHCRVPRFWKEDRQLGIWVARQRVARDKGRLSSERIARLGKLGFEWEPLDSRWKAMLEKLEAFRAAHGHGNVPHTYAPDPALAQWLVHKRHMWNIGQLSTERQRALEARGVVFDILDARWRRRLAELAAFKGEYGHCDVPVGFHDKQLANWVFGVRRSLRNGTLPEDRAEQVAALGLGAEAKVRMSVELHWEDMYRELEAFQRKHGHCRVPAKTLPLYSWITTQRWHHRSGSLPEEKRAALDRLGLVWDRDTDLWEEGFAELLAFKEKHGHVLGPFRLDHPSLSQWVTKQRRYKAKGKLEPERVKRLEALGFAWAGERGRRRKEHEPLDDLLEFRRRQGHLDVPDQEPHRDLFRWVAEQRALARRGALERGLRQRLDDLHFPVTPAELEWERMFARVKEHHDRRRGLRLEPGSKLGGWLEAQRRRARAGQIEPFQEGRLDELGLLERL